MNDTVYRGVNRIIVKMLRLPGLGVLVFGENSGVQL